VGRGLRRGRAARHPPVPVDHRSHGRVQPWHRRHEGPRVLRQRHRPRAVPDAALARIQALEGVGVGFLKRNTAWLGVVCLLAAAAVALFVPWLLRLRYILLGAGVVLLVLSLLLNAREARGAAARRGARYGAGAAVMILLALGVVVFANALSFRHSTRWD